GDYNRAFDLLFSDIYELWEQGNTETLRDRIESFPVECVGPSSHRMLLYALALFLCARFNESHEWIARAPKVLEYDDAAPRDDVTLLDALRTLTFGVDGWGDDGCETGARALERVENGSDIGRLGALLPEHLTRAFLVADDVDAARATLNAAHDGTA